MLGADNFSSRFNVSWLLNSSVQHRSEADHRPFASRANAVDNDTAVTPHDFHVYYS